MAWLVLGAGHAALAAEDLMPLPQSVACLTSARPEQTEPAVPAEPAPAADALIRTRMTFSAASEKPVLRVLVSSGIGAQLLAVRDHLLNYRLPCLKPGTRFVAVQDFQFVTVPGGVKVLPGKFTAVATEANLPEECREEFDQSWQWRAVDAPGPAKALVRLSFTSPNAAPEASILFDTGPTMWTDLVLGNIAQIRLPCVTDLGGTYVGIQLFAANPFELWSNPDRAGLTPAQLVNLMKHPKGDVVKFDLNTMDCPFEVDFEVFQPHLDNVVREVGEPNPQREAFLQWLRGVALNISDRDLRRVLAVPNKVTVPCAVLDLL